jgi:predicted DsbA family dithiol-disulfide isomerase
VDETAGAEGSDLLPASVPAVPAVCIIEYTDPGCPWAYSAEPFRRRLAWLYGDELTFARRLVGLAERPEEYADKGFTPSRQSAAFKQIAADHGMPIDTRERPRMAATVPACRAVVAARLHAPEHEVALLRGLRLRHFGGQLLDEPETIAGAARDAGIDPGELERWTAGDDVERALREDMAHAREPIPAARVLDHKLANWSGGVRYTCPSYEIHRAADDVRIAVPGFQPFPVYDVVTANFVPGLQRRDEPASAAEVLEWAGEPLATQEVAVVCGLSQLEAREELGRVARMTPLGTDGLWSLQ